MNKLTTKYGSVISWPSYIVSNRFELVAENDHFWSGYFGTSITITTTARSFLVHLRI